MDAEFRFHLESQVEDYVRQGLSREEAELRARREFGALELAKDECRDQRPAQRWIAGVFQPNHIARVEQQTCGQPQRLADS